MVLLRTFLLGGAVAAVALPAAAQYPYPQSAYPPAYQSFAPLSDSDQLAQQLRAVAADPTNLYALINAARLSFKVGDVDGAAALYTRAEKLSPANPQVKAGMARLLVNAQRPGEALRRFQDAQAVGASSTDFGSDRALAYDLIGEQDRAQREYRALLRVGSDDETVRRYALSLGISGRREPALALLEPLNRAGDRGAWRARAFILAMGNDQAGADRIATTMMPPGMADGLRPFFARLPQLSAVDRAFAVHFGEVRTNAIRMVDARQVPQLPALSPEPDPFPPARATQVAAAAQPQERGKRKKRRGRDAVIVAQAPAPYYAPLPPPPSPSATQLAALGATRLPPPPSAYGLAATAQRPTVLPPPADAYRPRERIAAAPVAAADEGPDQTTATLRAPVRLAATEQRAVPAASLPGPSAPLSPRTIPSASAGAPTALATSVPSADLAPATLAAAVTPPVSAAPVTVQPAASPAASPPVTAAPTFGTGALASVAPLTPSTPAALSQATGAPATIAPVVAVPADTAIEPAAVVAAAPAAAAGPLAPPPADPGGDAVLAAIVANITVPDTELAPTTAPPPVVPARLLSTVEKRAEVEADRPGAGLKLPRRDARGRYLDTGGRPLLDPRGRPLDAKGAAAWLAAQDEAPALKKDARGRYVDARGRPLLDARGRPLDARAAAARLAAQDDAAPDLKKDARGRFVDARGRPLLDARGRPLDAKAAAEKLAAADETPDPKLPRKDARGRFVDDKGKPLLDARGRPMDARAAAAWKVAEAKEAADARKATRGEPERIWVQVAGGANEATLGKEWTRVQGQAAALKGRQGWTTPLRATNRVLTGPFKTSGEAMTLVNTLKKQGVEAFMFTSDAGQKVTRLGR